MTALTCKHVGVHGAELVVPGRGAGPVQLRDQVQPQRHLVPAVVALHAELRTWWGDVIRD